MSLKGASKMISTYFSKLLNGIIYLIMINRKNKFTSDHALQK